MVAERHNSLVTGDSVVILHITARVFGFITLNIAVHAAPVIVTVMSNRILRHLILAEAALFAARRGTFPETGIAVLIIFFEIKIDAVLLIRR